MKLNFLDCWKRRRDLPAFESGELPPERAEALAAHLAICDRCRSEWEALAGVAEALRATPPAPVVPSVNLWSRIEAEILEPVPATPSPGSRWRPVALPVAGALACAGVFAAMGGLKIRIAESTGTTKTAQASPQPLKAAAPLSPVAAIARVVATPEPTPEPIEVESTPAPSPKPQRPKLRRPMASPRHDPFAPTEKTRSKEPRPDAWSNDDEIVEDATPIAIVAVPPMKDPEVHLMPQAGAEKTEPDEVIRVDRPLPTRSARRDAAADAEAAERRAADALGSPLDAVARASQPRKLFP